jgi:hypothetical protein
MPQEGIGQQVTTSTELPPLDEEGQLVLIPRRFWMSRRGDLRSRVIREFLSGGETCPVEDATWEGDQILQHPRFAVA